MFDSIRFSRHDTQDTDVICNAFLQSLTTKLCLISPFVVPLPPPIAFTAVTGTIGTTVSTSKVALLLVVFGCSFCSEVEWLS